MLNILSVFIGGGIGAALRFAVSLLSKKHIPGSILNPIFGSVSFSVFGTFLINILGCFLLGLVFGLTLNKIQNIPEALKLFITVGFLGGLTTFSTFNLEVFELIRAGKIFAGLFYMILSCVIGIIATFVGYLFTRF